MNAMRKENYGSLASVFLRGFTRGFAGYVDIFSGAETPKAHPSKTFARKRHDQQAHSKIIIRLKEH